MMNIDAYYAWIDANGKKYRECDLTDDYIRNIVKYVARRGADCKRRRMFDKVLEIAGRRGIDISEEQLDSCFSSMVRSDEMEDSLLSLDVDEGGNRY